MLNTPLIHTGSSIKIVNTHPVGKLIGRVPSPNKLFVAKEDLREKGDLLIRYLWYKATYYTHNMPVVNTYVSYYL